MFLLGKIKGYLWMHGSKIQEIEIVWENRKKDLYVMILLFSVFQFEVQ